MTRNLHERLGRAVDDPNLMQGHLRKGIKGALGLVGDRAVTIGRGNPVGAMFPMAPPPKPASKSVPAPPVTKPVQPTPKKKKRPSP